MNANMNPNATPNSHANPATAGRALLVAVVVLFALAVATLFWG